MRRKSAAGGVTEPGLWLGSQSRSHAKLGRKDLPRYSACFLESPTKRPCCSGESFGKCVAASFLLGVSEVELRTGSLKTQSGKL